MPRRSEIFILILVELAFIAGLQPATANPAITNMPFKISADTAKAACIGLDGTFRATAEGGFSCTYLIANHRIAQSCASEGRCTFQRLPYES